MPGLCPEVELHDRRLRKISGESIDLRDVDFFFKFLENGSILKARSDSLP